MLTALVRKSRCAFVSGLRMGAALVAASTSSIWVRASSRAAPLTEILSGFTHGAAEEALRDVDMVRIGRPL